MLSIYKISDGKHQECKHLLCKHSHLLMLMKFIATMIETGTINPTG